MPRSADVSDANEQWGGNWGFLLNAPKRCILPHRPLMRENDPFLAPVVGDEKAGFFSTNCAEINLK